MRTSHVRLSLSAILLTFFWVITLVSIAGATNYAITDLGSLGGPLNQSTTNGMNARGDVIGMSDVDAGGQHGFIWTKKDQMVDLGTLGGDIVFAYGINNHQQIVGQSAGHAFIWEKGVMKDLGALGTTSFSMANAINDAGVIVGASQNTPSGWNYFADYSACLWNNEGRLVDLNLGSWGAAVDINNKGQVVGQHGSNGFFWSPTSGMTIIQGWNQTVANSINEKGQVVGWTGGPVYSHPYIWTADDGLLQIGTMGGSAQGINNHGQVVGDHGGFAFIWDSGHGVQDLNYLISADSEWILKGAQDINDAGEIVVEAVNKINGYGHALLLTPIHAPVPEPSTMLLLGAGLVGLVGFRRLRK